MANLHPWPRRGHTIEFFGHIHTSPAHVWRAFTDEAFMQEWLMVSRADMPLVPGAEFSVIWEARGRASGKKTHGYGGMVKEVIVEELLALEWVLPLSRTTTYFSLQIQTPRWLDEASRESQCDIWIIHSGFPVDGVGLFEFDGHRHRLRENISDLQAMAEGRYRRPTPTTIAGVNLAGGAVDRGVLVDDVMVGSPADEAGIRPGEIIHAIDGRQLHSVDDFHRWRDARKPDERGVLTVGDREVTITMRGFQDARERFSVRQNDDWIRTTGRGVDALR